ncbi:MAG: M3 family metallopeptidase [Alphaproteobacteria bacterium]|nr:M3 family metallopeptidase [Alphaproteobacteria bacterium]
MTQDNNPLLAPSRLPNHAPPFNSIKPDHFLPAVEAAITQARAQIDAIKTNSAPPTFENTIVAMETAGETLGTATSVFYNLLSAAGTDELQALADQIGPVSANFSSDIILDPALFARVQAVYNQIDSLDLNEEQYTLLDNSYKGFVRGGALLDETKKTRLREISERLSVLGPAFSNNIMKSSEQFSMLIADEADLAGLPESARAAASDAAEEAGHAGQWLFTLDYPSYIPFVQYAENRSLREKMWRAFSSRAWKDEWDNGETLLEIVRLRHERAQLLGYANHADYVLERRMAERPDNVFAFIDKLKKAYRPAADADLRALRDFAVKNGGPADIQPWDVGYYSEKMRQSLFNFSAEDLRPYFPLEKVLAGVFTHFSKLFNLRFARNEDYEVWHKDVEAYDVFDDTNNKFVGTFFADFFPRKGKKSGAWKTSFRDQGLFEGKVERPVIAIVCNFTKPTKDAPSLLTFDEVSTLFHEMGHAVHGLLSDVTYSSLAGTNVLWDFVELPSQVQENWAYERETLDLLAAHYQTGAKIPDDLVEKLNDAKNYMVGWGGLRQVAFAQLDMMWHTTDPAGITDVGAFEDKAVADATLFPRLAGPFSAAFGHLFGGGYAAGYYSYKWAEVLDADTFELFLERGLYDRATAEAYKTHILSKGGSAHPAILYQRFRGRDADPDALLRREGLLAA